MTDVDFSSKTLFTQQPNLNNYVTIATIVSSQIPLANIFNGQQKLVEIVRSMAENAKTNANLINFGEINKYMSFKMFKITRSKTIFSAYISRVIPDQSQSNIQANTYQSVVQFKIDYDTCCVGSMMCLLTTDIQVRATLGDINVNGYTAHGNSSGITLNYQKDIKSIQYQYCPDFIYHYIDRISLGFANTGGNAPIWHQEVPIEIAKLYHTILSPPGMSETIARAVREDMFIVGHDPHRQFGDFSFQIKTPASIPSNTTATNLSGNGINFGFNQQIQSSQQQYATSNELAMYWNDTQIKEIGFGNLSNTDTYANPKNIQISYKDFKMSGSTLSTLVDVDKNKTKYISKLDLATELYWRFGSDDAQINLNINGTIYPMINSMAYIPIVSSDAALVTIIQGLSKQSKFPYHAEVINGHEEIIYVVPYVIYTTDKIQFCVSVVGHVTDSMYEISTGGKVVREEDESASLLQSRIQVQVVDDGNEGYMYYTVGDSLTSGTGQTGIEYMIGEAKYGLYIDTAFALEDLVKTIKYLKSNTLTTVTGGIIDQGPDTNAGFKKCIVSNVGGYNSLNLTLLDFITATAQTMGSYLLQSTGALSPLMQQANIAYTNIVTKPYDDNDLMLNSLSWYTTSNGAVLQPQGTDKYAVFRYNAALACNGQSEENYPAIKNIDDMSIHTYRKNHGVVDFYFPLQFLFICQDISQSFPHYACSAQSIIVKFEFNNPLAFINTSLSVRPLAMDPMDFGHNERILLNRVNTRDILQSNIQNMKQVLFYTRYAWVPILQPILSNYRQYTWSTNNYERFYKIFENLSSNYQISLAQFNKSNFYTRIWAFVTNKETIEVINNRGGPMEYVPIYVNRFNLESWDKIRFGNTTSLSQSTALTGSSAASLLQSQNSVYFQVPFESCQLKTKTSINMTDDMPYRAQMLYPYLMLEHQMPHSALKFNNLLQFNIDGVFYQEGFPNCMYSPAYAPDFELVATTKPGQQDFGMIIIPEYKNISYINSHVMLMKFSNNQ